MTMRPIALVVACLACAGHGRRIQDSSSAKHHNLEKEAHSESTARSSAGLDQSRSSAQALPPPAFVPGVAPAIPGPGAGRGLNFKPQRPATFHAHNRSSFAPDSMRNIDLIFRKPGLRMTGTSGDGDEDFQTMLSGLAPAKELPKLHEHLRDLAKQIDVAVEEGDFAAAIRYRDASRDLRAKDPASLKEDTLKAMWLAAETDDFKSAARYRKLLSILRGYLPEYQLAGLWLGSLPDGRLRVKIEYDAFNGDLVKASLKAIGEPLFEAHVSEPKDSSKESISFEGQTYAHYFEGTGYLDGNAVSGKLYLMGEGLIGFLFRGQDGGKQLALAGGGGGGAQIGGDFIAATANGGRGSDGGSGGGGSGETFVILRKQTGWNYDGDSIFAGEDDDSGAGRAPPPTRKGDPPPPSSGEPQPAPTRAMNEGKALAGRTMVENNSELNHVEKTPLQKLQMLRDEAKQRLEDAAELAGEAFRNLPFP